MLISGALVGAIVGFIGGFATAIVCLYDYESDEEIYAKFYGLEDNENDSD